MIQGKIVSYFIVLFVSLCSIVPCAQASPAFGPKQYIRTAGKPNVYTDNFPATAGIAKLIVLNGQANGQNPVSSALISINGVQIFAPQDFGQNVYRLEKM